MHGNDKKALSETDICNLFITPAIKSAGWDPMKQIRREVTLAPGPVVVRGNLSSRSRKKKNFADYVLSWEPGVPVAIVEAKDDQHTVSYGMQQALAYFGEPVHEQIEDLPPAYYATGEEPIEPDASESPDLPVW
jgi:type I restriction enzyme R subunit